MQDAGANPPPLFPCRPGRLLRRLHQFHQRRRLLVEQVTGRVRWRESMEWLASEGGVTRFVEVGSGKVLTGMAKRIAPGAESLALNTPEDLEAFARSIA